MASSGGIPRWAYAVIRQREHLDTGAHGPLYSMDRRPGHSRCVGHHSGPGLGSVCILLSRATGTDTYRPGRPVSVPAHGRPLLDRGVNQSQTTPYHLQRNGVIGRNNRILGDALRGLLLG